MLLRDRHAAALLDTIHGDWRESAACGDHDPELFFPIQDDKPGYGARIHAQIQAAKRVCRHCPVAGACLDFAIRNGERFGVWGGMTERERARHAGGRFAQTPTVQVDIPGHVRWAAYEVARLRQLMAAGTSRPAAARMLGRTESAVRQACMRYGITREESQG